MVPETPDEFLWFYIYNMMGFLASIRIMGFGHPVAEHDIRGDSLPLIFDPDVINRGITRTGLIAHPSGGDMRRLRLGDHPDGRRGPGIRQVGANHILYPIAASHLRVEVVLVTTDAKTVRHGCTA